MFSPKKSQENKTAAKTTELNPTSSSQAKVPPDYPKDHLNDSLRKCRYVGVRNDMADFSCLSGDNFFTRLKIVLGAENLSGDSKEFKP